MLKTYLNSLIKSFTQFDEYITFLHKPWSASIAYFIGGMILLGILQSSLLGIIWLPQVKSSIRESALETQKHYPLDLVLSWDGTHLNSTNNPTIISYPQPLKRVFDPGDQVAAAIIDSTIDNPNDSHVQTLALITHSTVFLTDFAGGWNSVPLSDVPGLSMPFIIDNTSINSQAESFADELIRTTNNSLPLIFLIMPFFLILATIWQGVTEVFLSYLVMTLYGLKIRFASVVKLALHIGVVTQTIHIIGSTLYPSSSFPFFGITYWIIIVGILYTIRTRVLVVVKK